MTTGVPAAQCWEPSKVQCGWPPFIFISFICVGKNFSSPCVRASQSYRNTAFVRPRPSYAHQQLLTLLRRVSSCESRSFVFSSSFDGVSCPESWPCVYSLYPHWLLSQRLPLPVPFLKCQSHTQHPGSSSNSTTTTEPSPSAVGRNFSSGSCRRLSVLQCPRVLLRVQLLGVSLPFSCRVLPERGADIPGGSG